MPNPRAKPFAWLPIVALAACLAVLGGCQAYKDGSKRTIGEFTDDANIQTKVKTALMLDDEIKGFPMNVDVYKGVVSLYGRIPSEDARARALSIAANVRGVVGVQDRLTLVPPK